MFNFARNNVCVPKYQRINSMNNIFLLSLFFSCVFVHVALMMRIMVFFLLSKNVISFPQFVFFRLFSSQFCYYLCYILQFMCKFLWRRLFEYYFIFQFLFVSSLFRYGSSHCVVSIFRLRTIYCMSIFCSTLNIWTVLLLQHNFVHSFFPIIFPIVELQQLRKTVVPFMAISAFE